MRSPGRLGLLILVALAVALVLAVGLWRQLYVDRPTSDSPVRVEILAGASLDAAAHRLAEVGLIDRPWHLTLVARLEGGARSIKAGQYEMARGLAPASILRKLVAGEVSTVRITLFEGWTARQVGRVLADSLGLEPAVLDSLTRQPVAGWQQALALPEGAHLEGYLFPETYRFARGLSAVEVLSTLVETSRAAASDTLRARAKRLGFSWHEVLTLASIIEAETSVPAERSLVSAVYHNRLREGWKLEADPTVAYAVEKMGQPLTYRDLQVDSAYNTYRNRGLPPGPINNPGLAAIVAALHPEAGFDAMYFVADGDGGHVFSRTWEEHRRAVREYRRRRDAQRR